MTKKAMVSVLLVAGLLFGGVGLSAAQRGEHGGRGRGHHGPGMGGRGHLFSEEAMERRLNRLTERLSLDEHQVTLVREILGDARTRAMAIRDGGEAGPARREQFRALMDDVHGRIDAVLNEAQRAELATLRGELRERFGRRGEHGPLSAEGMERRLERLTERLSLDASQVTAVRAVLEDARTRAASLRGSTERGPARREQMHALMEETAGRIEALLTDAQRTEFATIRAEMRARHDARREAREERGERGEGRGRREGRGRGAGRGASPEGI